MDFTLRCYDGVMLHYVLSYPTSRGIHTGHGVALKTAQCHRTELIIQLIEQIFNNLCAFCGNTLQYGSIC